MLAATFSCDECNTVDAPQPCPCVVQAYANGTDSDYEFVCRECGVSAPFLEIAPGIWICPGCVDMHRRRVA